MVSLSVCFEYDGILSTGFGGVFAFMFLEWNEFTSLFAVLRMGRTAWNDVTQTFVSQCRLTPLY